jgi:hypothetical protein
MSVSQPPLRIVALRSDRIAADECRTAREGRLFARHFVDAFSQQV